MLSTILKKRTAPPREQVQVPPEEKATTKNREPKTFAATYLKRCKSVQEISARFLSGLAKELEIVQGVFLEFRKKKKGGTLTFLAGYAYTSKSAEDYYFEAGEGFPGQVAADRKPILLNDVPDNYLVVRTGLGEAKPRSILILPVEYNRHLYGVVELASFKAFTEDNVKYIKALTREVGAAMDQEGRARKKID